MPNSGYLRNFSLNALKDVLKFYEIYSSNIESVFSDLETKMRWLTSILVPFTAASVGFLLSNTFDKTGYKPMVIITSIALQFVSLVLVLIFSLLRNYSFPVTKPKNDDLETWASCLEDNDEARKIIIYMRIKDVAESIKKNEKVLKKKAFWASGALICTICSLIIPAFLVLTFIAFS
jgi:hypothetical protein